MSLGFVLLLVIGGLFLVAFMHVREELANERRSATSGAQKRVRPRSEDTVTYSGNG